MSKRPQLEIGQSVGALLVGGPLHGQNVAVRLGLNGLPRSLLFPDARHLRVELGFPEFELAPDGGLRVKRRALRSVKYVLYDDWPARYLFEHDDDDRGGKADNPEPVVPGEKII